MEDVTAVMERIQSAAHPDANIIFGLGFDENLTDAVRVIVIATDFEGGEGTDAAAPEEVAAVAEKQRTPDPAPEKRETSGDDWDKVWDEFFK